jgi:hypothetical protein
MAASVIIGGVKTLLSISSKFKISFIGVRAGNFVLL